MFFKFPFFLHLAACRYRVEILRRVQVVFLSELLAATQHVRVRPHHARRVVGIRMTLLPTEWLFWHCGAHTAEPKIGLIRPVPPIPHY